MRMRTLATNPSRERVLVLALAAIAFASFTFRFISTSNDLESAQAFDPQSELARLEHLNNQREEIDKALLERQSMWAKAEAGMFAPEPAASQMASYGQQIADLASDAGVEISVGNLAIDSSTSPRRVRAHVAARGEPEAIIVFLDTLARHPQHLWTRGIQIARTAGSTTTPVMWSGQIELESLIRPSTP